MLVIVAAAVIAAMIIAAMRLAAGMSGWRCAMGRPAVWCPAAVRRAALCVRLRCVAWRRGLMDRRLTLRVGGRVAGMNDAGASEGSGMRRRTDRRPAMIDRGEE